MSPEATSEQFDTESQREEQANSNASMYVWVLGGVAFGFTAWTFCPNESKWVIILFSAVNYTSDRWILSCKESQSCPHFEMNL